MKNICIILLSLFSSCIILPLPAHREEGRVFIKEPMISFIHLDTTLKEEVLLKLGDPDAVALQEQVIIYQWTAYKGFVGFVGLGSGVVADIKQQRFFLVGFNPDNTVKKMEIINHPIDKPQKPLLQFLQEWIDTDSLTAQLTSSNIFCR